MQSRRLSALEAVANVAVGFGVAWAANLVILPWYGYNVTGGRAFEMGLWFTGISLVRAYLLRRAFEQYNTARIREHSPRTETP